MEISPRFNPSIFLETLVRMGVPHKVYEHQAVFTVAEANDVSDKFPGTHTRNLFLRDKKERMFLLTLRHETPVDLKKLSDFLGVSRLSFGSPERLWTYLGVTPGSVTPFAILNDVEKKVKLVLELGMMQTDIINVHPLINTMTVSVSSQGMMQIFESFGVQPLVTDLSGVAPDKI